MNTQEILSLLDKYYRGETSDDEENILRIHFQENTVPPELENENQIYSFYRSSAKVPAPSIGFENKIISTLDELEKSKKSRHSYRFLYKVLSSAAVFMLLIGSYFLFIHESEPADTFSDPTIAYAETLKILFNVSASFNSGIDALDPVRKIETTTSESIGAVRRSTLMIENNLKPLGFFQEAMSIVNSSKRKI